MAIDNAQLARPYAEAAHRHAQSAGGDAPKQWSDFCTNLATSYQDQELQNILDDPRINPGQVTKVLEGLLDQIGVKDNAMRNFVLQLHENNRLEVVAEINQQYELLRREAESVLQVRIRSAFEVEDAQIQQISERLKSRYNKQKINAEVVVDETLGGGIVIEAGDDVIDCSITAELNQLRTSLHRSN